MAEILKVNRLFLLGKGLVGVAGMSSKLGGFILLNMPNHNHVGITSSLRIVIQVHPIVLVSYRCLTNIYIVCFSPLPPSISIKPIIFTGNMCIDYSVATIPIAARLT